MIEFIGKGSIPPEVILSNALSEVEKFDEVVVLLKSREDHNKVVIYTSTDSPWFLFGAVGILNMKASMLKQGDKK